MPTDFPGYTYHRLLVGYHGCDRKTAERVLLHGDHLKKSSNRWDWLGEGIYFWEHGYQRALEFAQWKQKRGEIEDPMVVGAYIHLGRCFDLTDTWATAYLAPFHEELKQDLGESLPVNRPAGENDFDLVLRGLDCAVLNYALRTADGELGGGDKYFQTARGVFIPCEKTTDQEAAVYLEQACDLGDRVACDVLTPKGRGSGRSGTVDALQPPEIRYCEATPGSPAT